MTKESDKTLKINMNTRCQIISPKYMKKIKNNNYNRQ